MAIPLDVYAEGRPWSGLAEYGDRPLSTTTCITCPTPYDLALHDFAGKEYCKVDPYSKPQVPGCRSLNPYSRWSVHSPNCQSPCLAAGTVISFSSPNL